MVLLCIVLAIAGGCGGGDEDAGGGAGVETMTDDSEVGEATGDLGEARTFELVEQNDSGTSGTATIAPTGDDSAKVAIDLDGSGDVPQPAHIHEGSCEDLGPIAFPLENVEDGNSSTAVDVSLEQLEDGDYAVNVHKSEEEMETYVACVEV